MTLYQGTDGQLEARRDRPILETIRTLDAEREDHAREHNKTPDHRVMSGAIEIAGAWTKADRDGGSFLSVKSTSVFLRPRIRDLSRRGFWQARADLVSLTGCPAPRSCPAESRSHDRDSDPAGRVPDSAHPGSIPGRTVLLGAPDLNAMDDDDQIARAARAKRGSPFLNTEQAAFYLKLSSRLLKRMRRSGRGPVFRRHSRYVQYHIDDLDAWSAAQSCQAVPRD